MNFHPDWIRPHWPVPARVKAVITTRVGGVSTGPWGAGDEGGMNLCLTCGDDPANVHTNRARLRQVLPAEPRWIYQIHGSIVLDAEDIGRNSSDPPTADAVTALSPNIVCAVMTADCLPVLLADQGGRAVAAAHAGWRGLAGGIIQQTVMALRKRLADPRAAIVAYLGPAIGPKRFEVGPEVREEMLKSLPQAERAFVPHGDGKLLGNLFMLAREALMQAGVHEVHGGGLCTASDRGRFYSYRRDRVTGRHVALIWRE